MSIEDALSDVSKNLVGVPYEVLHKVMDTSELMLDKSELVPILNSRDIIQGEDEARFALDCLQDFAASYASDGEGHYARFGIVPEKKPGFWARHPTLKKAVAIGAAILTLGLVYMATNSDTQNAPGQSMSIHKKPVHWQELEDWLNNYKPHVGGCTTVIDNSSVPHESADNCNCYAEK